MRTLIVERKGQEDTSLVAPGVMFTPPVGSDDYWAYRIGLSEAQALIAFPKFGTIGVGFAVEEDWNSNLPWSVSPERLLVHIGHNKGDESITDVQVYEAIVRMQEEIAKDLGTTHAEETKKFGFEPLTLEEALTELAKKREQIKREQEEMGG